MCQGIPILANNDKAIAGYKTNSHTTMAEGLNVSEDDWLKLEYHWWDKELIVDEYDDVAKEYIKKINVKKATSLARQLVKKDFNTQIKVANWLRDVNGEWGRLMEVEHRRLAKLVNPKLIIYQNKVAKFKKEPIEKYNPYQATKLPELKDIKKKFKEDQVGVQVWHQVRVQVWHQVRVQGWNQVGDQVGDQVGVQVGDQVWNQVWNQVRDQVGDQVGDQVWNQVRVQVRDQVWAVSYWGIKVALNLPIKHWFFDFLKLGIMIVFVKGKAKIFGKQGMYLGEYDEKDLFN